MSFGIRSGSRPKNRSSHQARPTAMSAVGRAAKSSATGYSGRVPVRSCTAQALPSGSEKNTNAPHGKRWMSLHLDAAAGRARRARPRCRHDELQALDRAGLGLGDARADRDRAGRAGRRELHEAQVLVDLVVVVGVEAGLVDVERLRAVDVGDGHRDQLELEVHGRRLSAIAVSFCPQHIRAPQGLRQRLARGRSRAPASSA